MQLPLPPAQHDIVETKYVAGLTPLHGNAHKQAGCGFQTLLCSLLKQAGCRHLKSFMSAALRAKMQQ